MKRKHTFMFMIALSLVIMTEPVTSTFSTACGIPLETTLTAEAATEYYKPCRSNCSSIVDGLKSIGVDSSYTNRKKIAQINGISNYSGTASQNTQMLNLLKQGKLIKSVTSPGSTGTTVYYSPCGSNYSSIVDGLRSIGVDSSYTNRKSIAAVNGISNYSGTASQNTQMLNLLKQGRLVKSKENSVSSTSGPSDYQGSHTGTAELGIFTNGKNFSVFSQKDEEWGSYPYLKGTIGGKYQNTNIYHSGCHLLALVNGTYWLTGKFISPTWLAQRAIDKGYRTNGDIDMYGLYKDISNNYGSKYGIEYVTCTNSFSSLKTYLEKGYVGLGGGNGHVMAFVAYSGDQFLVLDSFYTYNGRSYVWKTENQMTGIFDCSYFYIIRRR